VKINPRQPNANLQLARLAADRHDGARALEYLAQVNDAQPATRMLRAEALHWAGKPAAAVTMLDGVKREAAADSRLEYLYGITCARIGAYDRAVAAFNSVLVQHPDDFDLLFNLGRAAARAKLYDRALHALEVAAKLQPGNPDALMELAGVNAAMGDYAHAIYILAQAKQLAPGRPEIPLALAQAAEAGEYYGDAALAYDEYLRLKPGDDAARRDRALVCGFTEGREAEGLRELTSYVQNHPADPLGYHDLAKLTWREHPQQALDALTTAVRLDPRLAPALVNLGWLLNRMGRTAEAIPHFQKAVEIDPGNSRALAQLGAAYISLDRAAEAEKVLRQALAISPGDPEILMHLGRALMDSGRETEARQYLDQFQKIQPRRVRGPWRQPAMIESASLPAEERSKREIERLRKEAFAHQDDPELQLRLASLLLVDGRVEQAEVEFRVLLTRNLESRTWLQAGSYLMGFERYQLAREFLERAAVANPAANLDLAIAIFYLEGPAKALDVLERAPVQQRSGDYLLLKAKILDAAGQAGESEKVLEEGLQLSDSRPKIAKEAALLLVRHDRKDLALEFLAKAAGSNPDLLLTRAVVLALANGNSTAEAALKQIESQWPEWDQPYVAHGLLLEKVRPGEARQKLQTAIALGSQDAAARCALARLASGASSDPQCSCAGGLYQMLFPQCSRP
jgi:tetratricopeptide (TPR) repeat protein